MFWQYDIQEFIDIIVYKLSAIDLNFLRAEIVPNDRVIRFQFHDTITEENLLISVGLFEYHEWVMAGKKKSLVMNKIINDMISEYEISPTDKIWRI